MSGLLLKGINKIYPGGNQAVFNFCLDIRDKEFIVFVGPSGCGKSTTLRMIAGLEEISSGELYIDGKLVNDVVPKDRDIAMVFQNYALYPHMSVYDNMAFGLKLRKVPKEVIDEKVKAAAEILGITDYLSRQRSSASPITFRVSPRLFRVVSASVSRSAVPSSVSPRSSFSTSLCPTSMQSSALR